MTMKQCWNMIVAIFLATAGFAGWGQMASEALAEETHVAIASNFTATAKEIAAAFERETGHKAVLSFGSTGKLFTQIANGAPFQVFLAADTKHPEKAEAEGLAVTGTRFTYATGKIVLYSSNPELVDKAGKVLETPAKFAKLAIANPMTAPYGTASIKTMEALGVYAGVKDKIVQGDNIAQTYQFVATGNAQLGFIALSQVVADTRGSKWVVPSNLYTPIKQDAVLLKTGAESKPAKAFLTFLRGRTALAMIEKFGYGIQ